MGASSVFTAMGRARDPFRIPRAGIEMAPAAGLAALDVNFNGGHFSNGEFLAVSTLGCMAVYACYQASGASADDRRRGMGIGEAPRRGEHGPG
ncbi:MAG: hypothetical protein ACKOYK_12060, partial [Cyanobium sp.]